MDGHDEDIWRFSRVCESVWNPVTIVSNIIERKPLHALVDMMNLQLHMLSKCHSTVINVCLYLPVKAAGFYADNTAEVTRTTAERKLKIRQTMITLLTKTVKILQISKFSTRYSTRAAEFVTSFTRKHRRMACHTLCPEIIEYNIFCHTHKFFSCRLSL